MHIYPVLPTNVHTAESLSESINPDERIEEKGKQKQIAIFELIVNREDRG